MHKLKKLIGNIFGKGKNSPSVARVRAERVDYPKHLNTLVSIAKNHDWRLKSYFSDTGAMVFIPKEPSPHKNIVVYTTNMTVSTAQKNAAHGLQLYRKNIRMADMHKIFEDPRRSGTGYYAKHKR